MTSMTRGNPLRRFVRCLRFVMRGGCEYFKWIHGSLWNKMRSMVVTLMVKNDSIVAETEALQKIKKEREVEKQ